MSRFEVRKSESNEESTMTTRELLHGIVDELPESDLVMAVRILKGIELAPTPLQILVANAPIDDEPADEDDLDGALAEAFEETELMPHDEVMRSFSHES
jgi:hypothetical protein